MPSGSLARAVALAILSILAAAPGAPAQQPGSPAYRPGQSWPRTQFPDGSGSIALPPGWRLNSARPAAAELQGPRGEAVAVGITMPIGPPQFSTPSSLAAPYMPPADSAGPFSIRHPASNSPAKSQVCSPVRVIVMRSQPSLRRTCRTASGCREFSMTLKAA